VTDPAIYKLSAREIIEVTVNVKKQREIVLSEIKYAKLEYRLAMVFSLLLLICQF